MGGLGVVTARDGGDRFVDGGGGGEGGVRGEDAGEAGAFEAGAGFEQALGALGAGMGDEFGRQALDRGAGGVQVGAADIVAQALGAARHGVIT